MEGGRRRGTCYWKVFHTVEERVLGHTRSRGKWKGIHGKYEGRRGEVAITAGSSKPK